MGRIRSIAVDLLRGLLLALLTFHAAAAALPPAPDAKPVLRAVTCLGAAIPGEDGELQSGAHAACWLGGFVAPAPLRTPERLSAPVPADLAPAPLGASSAAPALRLPPARGPPAFS